MNDEMIDEPQDGDPQNDDPQDDKPVVLEPEDAERLSRFLALVLRHRAHNFDLEVDDEGFVSIDDLLDVIDEEHRALDWVEFEHIEALTKTEGRQRFQVKDDRVRATYGHSFRRPINYPSAEPPAELYVGVLSAKLPELRAKGLLPTGRQYVHLSESSTEAEEIGRHQGDDSMVVTVQAGKAAKEGVQFHHPTRGLYLVNKLASKYLDVEMQFGRRARKGRRR